MSHHKPLGTGLTAKYSFMMSKELDDRVRYACSLRKNLTPSQICRDLITEHLEAYISRLEGKPQPITDAITLALPLTFQPLILNTATAFNLDAASFIQLILSDHIVEYVEKAQQKRELLASLQSPSNSTELNNKSKKEPIRK